MEHETVCHLPEPSLDGRVPESLDLFSVVSDLGATADRDPVGGVRAVEGNVDLRVALELFKFARLVAA